MLEILAYSFQLVKKMKKTRNDLSGSTFGELTVIKMVDSLGAHDTKWECRCSCGRTVCVLGYNLTHGRTRSCGCKKNKHISIANKRSNKYQIVGNVVTMYTRKGKTFIIDLDDFERVKQFCWHNYKGYISANVSGKQIQLHRFIMNAPDGLQVDHINHVITDNRKCNLRLVTGSQNCFNKDKTIKNTSGHRGVSFDKSRNKWRAFIVCKGKYYTIGRYNLFEDAVNARKLAESELFGEYAFNDNIDQCPLERVEKEDKDGAEEYPL